MLLRLFFEFETYECSRIVVTYPVQRILCLGPQKVRTLYKARFDQCGLDGDVRLGYLIEFLDRMDAVAEL